MRRKKIIIAFVVVLVFLLIMTFTIQTPSEPELTPNPLNAELYFFLSNGGLENALVDITPERALIRYNLPENVSTETTNFFVMKASARIAPNSSKIIIQVYENFTPLEEVIVSTEDVLAFMNGTITYEEFEKRIEIKSLNR